MITNLVHPHMRFLLLVFTTLVTACAVPERLTIPGVNSAPAAVRLVDARTEWSKRSAGAGEGSVRAGTYADDTLSPPPMDLVRSWLDPLAERLTDKTVVIDAFDFGVLDPSGAHAQISPQSAGLVGSLLTPRIVYLKILGRVGEKRFSVDVYDKQPGPVSEERLRSVVAKAQAELVLSVRNVVGAA